MTNITRYSSRALSGCRNPGTRPGRHSGESRNPVSFRTVFLTAFTLILLIAVSIPVSAQDANLDKILGTAERFFQVLQAKQFSQTWALLSSRSKDVIVDDLYKGSNAQYSPEQIRSDMQAGGMIAAGYWKGVLQTFDPKIILENSKWEAGQIGAKEAELLITGKKASQPARLKMYYEGGGWKVGLVESFWTRKK